MASGMNRNLAAPSRKTTGTNTMQMQIVETNAGTAISAEPSRIERISDRPSAKYRWMFSIATVASSTSMPTARESPQKVTKKIDSARVIKKIKKARIENRIEREKQLRYFASCQEI